MALQITVPDVDGLDQAWRLLRSQDVVEAAELHVAGRGLVWQAELTADGQWTARAAAALA